MLFESQSVILAYAMRLVGTPYVWGGNHILQGFDCSGLVLELLRAAGKWPQGNDNSAQGIFTLLRSKSALSVIDQPTFGSLAFYGVGKAAITHVGFCVTADTLVEAGGGGRDTLTLDAARKRGAVVRVRPIKARDDLVDVLMP